MMAFAMGREHSFQICCSASVFTRNLPEFRLRNGPPHAAVSLASIQRFLNTLAKDLIIDKIDDVERRLKLF
jgi:hypothetical protein